MFYLKRDVGIKMLIVYQLTGNIKKETVDDHSADCNMPY
jgi:hypothetical protein